MRFTPFQAEKNENERPRRLETGGGRLREGLRRPAQRSGAARAFPATAPRNPIAFPAGMRAGGGCVIKNIARTRTY